LEKRGKAIHISDLELRRSERVHNLHKGFRSPICKDQNCLGCSTHPPTLSTSVVHDLGATFCKLDASNLSDEALNAKAPKKGAVCRPKSKKPKPSDNGSREGTSKKD